MKAIILLKYYITLLLKNESHYKCFIKYFFKIFMFFYIKLYLFIIYLVNLFYTKRILLL